jgi:hypothetical protein
MFGQVFAHSRLLLFPLAALWCSLFAFLTTVARAAFMPRERQRALAELPLSHDEDNHG